MSDQSPNPQLSPTTAIHKDRPLHAETQKWYEYPVRAQPHHTDYGGGLAWNLLDLDGISTGRVPARVRN